MNDSGMSVTFFSKLVKWRGLQNNFKKSLQMFLDSFNAILDYLGNDASSFHFPNLYKILRGFVDF